MSDRPDLPRVKPTEAPSFFNREAGGWGYLGMIVGGIAAGVSSMRAPAGEAGALKRTLTYVFGGQAIGVVMGGLMGMARQNKEVVEGRVVKDPTYINNGYWGGALIANALLTPVRMFMVKQGTTLRSLNTLSLIGEMVGGGAGMVMRKDSMQRDFDTAVGIRKNEIAVAKQKVHALEKTVPASYKDSVNADESASLADKLVSAVTHSDRAASEPQAENVRS